MTNLWRSLFRQNRREKIAEATMLQQKEDHEKAMGTARQQVGEAKAAAEVSIKTSERAAQTLLRLLAKDLRND